MTQRASFPARMHVLFSAMPTHMVNAAKFNRNPFTKYRNTASLEIGINVQRTDKQETYYLRRRFFGVGTNILL